MNTDSKPFLKLLGYSRKERRSTFILLLVLVFAVSTRYLIPAGEIEIKDLSRLLAPIDSVHVSLSDTVSNTLTLFNFDPNYASFDTLTELGLSGKQARTIINYRNKGGKFRHASDVKKIYGIDEQTTSKLLPYIIIKKDTGSIKYFNTGSLAQPERHERLDLNKCDSAALDKLPGLGPVLSSRIIKFRKLLGGFVSAEQLKEVYGLQEATFNNLADKVFADSSGIIGIKINDAGFRELSRHPYLNRYEIESIIKYKELKGRFSNTAELVDNKILTAEKAKKLSAYLRF